LQGKSELQFVPIIVMTTKWVSEFFGFVTSDFDTCLRNLLSNQPLMGRWKVVGTTDARFGQFSPVYGSADWAGEGGGG
jgi:hypothetical protein